MISRKRAVAAGAIALAMSVGAAAQSFYVGGSVSTARLHSDFADQVSQAARAAPDTAAGAASAEMQQKTGGRVFAGMDLTRWLGVELDYMGAGTIATSYSRISIHGAILGPTVVTTEQKLDGVGILAVARSPSWNGFSIHARAGVIRTRLRFDSEACRQSPNFPVTCTTPQHPDLQQTLGRAGLGVGYRFSDHLTLDGGWERLFGVGKKLDLGFDPQNNALGKFDVDLFSVGLAYHF